MYIPWQQVFEVPQQHPETLQVRDYLVIPGHTPISHLYSRWQRSLWCVPSQQHLLDLRHARDTWKMIDKTLLTRIRTWNKYTYGSWFSWASHWSVRRLCWCSIVSQVVLLFDALSRVTVWSWLFIVLSVILSEWQMSLTLDSFLLIIPTRSQRPTKYRPKFPPLCSPDIGWKPITSERSFHFSSLTSIQWAVIPRNDPFVLSAVQPSDVSEIFPGASCQTQPEFVSHTLIPLASYSPIFLSSKVSTDQRNGCVWTLTHRE